MPCEGDLLISFGVRRRGDAYIAEVQFPHGTTYATKGPFESVEAAAREAETLGRALAKEMGFTLEPAH